MKWYAETSRLRTRQLLTDLAVLLWLLLCGWLGLRVHTLVDRLAGPGRQLQQAGQDLERSLGRAGRQAGDVPLLGGALRSPLEAASRAGRAVGHAGVAEQSTVARLALLLGLVVALLPALVVLARWLPGRLRWARSSAAAVALRDDVELMALRAATTAPLSRLARLGPEPVSRWRRGEPGAAEALAAVALADLGLRPRAGRRRAGTAYDED